MRESYDDCTDVAMKIETVVKVADNKLAGIGDTDSDAVMVKPEPDNVILIKPEILDPLSENSAVYL